MSTFGTLVWVDLRPDGPVADVAAGLDRLRIPDVDNRSADDGVWIDVEADLVRLTTNLTFRTEVVDEIRSLVSSADWGRVAVAEDNDEFGACWTVFSVVSRTVRIIHRRYILNADPRKRRDVRRALADFVTDGTVADPRVGDVAGPEAAQEAALLFGVPVDPVVYAEAGSDRAFEDLGTVGGPFPWLEPMGLPWPGRAAGRPFVPRH